MSPLSWPVLVGTLTVGSPALYAAQVSGTLSLDVALVRLLICMAGVWFVCSIVASLVEGTVAANEVAEVDTTELPAVPLDGFEDTDAA
jgi:preprotein translocase subunit SecG